MATDNTSRYIYSPVEIGPITVTGILTPSGEFRITDADAARVINEDVKNSVKNVRLSLSRSNTKQKSLKPSDIKAFPSLSILMSKPDKVSVVGQNAKVNAMTLEDAVLYWSAFGKANPKAHALVVACATETLERRFNRAFGIKVSEAEYDVKLSERWERLTARFQWCDVIKSIMVKAGYYHTDKAKVNDEFKKITIQVNKALFGVSHFNCDRDTMTDEQQQTITLFEKNLVHFYKRNPKLNHFDLVDKTLQLFN